MTEQFPPPSSGSLPPPLPMSEDVPAGPELPSVPWGPGEALVLFLMQFVVLNIIVFLIIAPSVHRSLSNSQKIVAGALTEGLAALLVVLWVRVRFKAGVRLLGLHFERFAANVGRGLSLGFVSWLIAVPAIGTITFWIAALFVKGTVHRPDQIQLAGPTTIQLILFGVVAIVMAPIAEELLYRGFIHQGLRTRCALWPASIVSGAIFMLAHAPVWLIFPSIFAFGIMQARLFERRASLVSTIVAHMLFNSIGYATYLISR